MISIIIIVKDDPKISNTLYSLHKVKKPLKTEIIVVDASKKIDLNCLKIEYKKVKWIYFKSKYSKATIPEQRNLGIKNSKGNIIVFIDASCIPQKNWLVNLIEPIIQKNENIVSGATISEGKSTIHDEVLRTNKKIVYLKESPTINLAINRAVFDNIGMFNEKMEYGSDINFTWRAIDSGYKIFYEPRAIVSHDWGNWKEELKRSYKYGKARMRLYKQFPNRRSDILKSDPIAVIYPIYILGLPLTFVFKYYPLLILIPFLKNINKKPFQTVVDHLIFGLGVLVELFRK